MTDIATLKHARHAPTQVEDVQGHADTRRIPINRVGIKDIAHPVRVKDRSEGEQHTIATFNMYVNLPHNFKGTHMSRFVEILHGEREISVESFRAMLEKMTQRLEADAGHIEMTLPVLRDEEGAGLRRREPDGLQGLRSSANRRTARRKPGFAWSCRSRACAPAPRRSRNTARTTSGRTSPSRRSCANTSGSRS